MRRHNERNQRQHQALLDAYRDNAEECRDVIGWFMMLPLWLELDGLRVVHACWDEWAMTRLEGLLAEGNRLSATLLRDASTYGRQEFRDMETLLRGKEMPLKAGQHIVDNDGHKWPNIRIRWRDQKATTYPSVFMVTLPPSHISPTM